MHEIEINNSKSSANYLPYNLTKKRGNIRSLSDEDWYKLDVDANTKLNINFWHAADNYVYNLFKVIVYNSNEDILSSTNIYAPDSNTFISVGLNNAGSYYIVVETACTSKSGRCEYMMTNEYEISISTFNVDHYIDELEPNNDMNSATDYPDGIANGQISSISDIDYYKLTLTGRADVQIYFLHDGDNYIYNLWYVDILNSDGTTINSTDILAPDTNTPIGFSVDSAGEYYIKVTGCQSGSQCEVNRTNPYYLRTIISPIDKNKIVVIPLF